MTKLKDIDVWCYNIIDNSHRGLKTSDIMTVLNTMNILKVENSLEKLRGLGFIKREMIYWFVVKKGLDLHDGDKV